MHSSTGAVEWVLKAARENPHKSDFSDRLAGYLNSAGFELMRMNVILTVLHPQVAAQVLVWRSQSGYTEVTREADVFDRTEKVLEHGVVKQIMINHDTLSNPAYLNSPVYKILNGEIDFFHEPIQKEDGSYTYDILEDMHKAGASDYLVRSLQFSDGGRGFLSFATVRPGGFTAAQVQLTAELVLPLSYIFELHAVQHKNSTLLNTYLGREPGARVTAGSIKKGDVEELEAAIWFSDIRKFTDLSTRLEPTELVSLLNEYFTVLGDAINSEGGEILKFIGDAVLAVFPVTVNTDDAAGSGAAQPHSLHDGRKDACSRALAAARAAEASLGELNASLAGRGKSSVQHGIGLHFGLVEYGNIGSNERLDFTVIGEAVNLAARIESLCSSLEERLLVSADFHGYLAERGTSAGLHALKGFQQPCEVFTV